MIRSSLLLILTLLVFTNRNVASGSTFFAGTPDTTRSTLKAECTISFNSNGIASIPAFSLGKPALIASAGLAKGRFSFDPTLAYGLDMHPWFIDSWLHLRIIERPAFKLRTGINFSNFFAEYQPPEGVELPHKLLPAERYWALEIAATYFLSPTGSFTLMYWNDRGQDPGTLIGHYLSLSGDKSDIRIGGKLLLSANLQLFYINYDGNNDGLFCSPRISSTIMNQPFSIFFQANQAISSNIEPFPGFYWNIGLAYKM